MIKSAIGARVLYCGHDGYFVADIWEVKGAVVVSTDPRNTDPRNLIRDECLGPPTHSLSDFPSAGYWKPSKGVFVVPSAQLKVLKKKEAKRG